MSTMKTAEEWLTEPTHRKTEQQVVEWIKQIQLDAFKAGMTEAAEVIPYRVPMLNNTYGDYVDKCLLMQQEIKDKIITARDRKDLSL